MARYGDFAERFSITFHLSEVCGVGMSKKIPILFDLKNLSMCTSAGAPQSFTSKSVFFLLSFVVELKIDVLKRFINRLYKFFAMPF